MWQQVFGSDSTNYESIKTLKGVYSEIMEISKTNNSIAISLNNDSDNDNDNDNECQKNNNNDNQCETAQPKPTTQQHAINKSRRNKVVKEI